MFKKATIWLMVLALLLSSSGAASAQILGEDDHAVVQTQYDCTGPISAIFNESVSLQAGISCMEARNSAQVGTALLDPIRSAESGVDEIRETGREWKQNGSIGKASAGEALLSATEGTMEFLVKNRHNIYTTLENHGVKIDYPDE